MIRLWAILLGLAVAYAAAQMVTATFAKAAKQFERNIQSRPTDVEAAALGGVGTGGGIGVRFHRQISSRFLSSGSEGVL